jgi:DNA-binding response OmpR family regulator
MPRPNLKGCTILVVEDEPLIVMDISMAFDGTGAHLTTTNTVKHARLLVEHDGLSAAILDHALTDGDSTSLCTRLTERGVPYLMYSGFKTFDNACKGAPHLMKPASHEQLLNAMEALIGNAQNATVGAK